MLKKRICAAVLMAAMMVSMMVPAQAASKYELIDAAPPMPNVTKYTTDGWLATWFRMETGLQVGDYMYSYDRDPAKGDSDFSRGVAADAYQITQMPQELEGADFFVTRPNNLNKLVFWAEQDITIYAAIDNSYAANPSSLNGWTETDYTMAIKDGTTYRMVKKDFDGEQEINLGTGGQDGGKKHIFYAILPQNGETVYNATQTGNALVAEGVAPEKNEADEAYQYYLNDVFNMNADLSAYGGNAALVEIGSDEAEEQPTEKTVAAGENMALNAEVEANSTSYGTTADVTDGDDQTYWQGPKNGSGYGTLTTPNVVTIDLGGQAKFTSVVIKARNRETWADRTQNIKLEYSTDGVNFQTLSEAQDYLFTMTKNNVLDPITFNETTARYVRVTVYSNTGELAAQLAEVEVYGPAQTIKLEPKPIAGSAFTDKAVAVAAGGTFTKTLDEAADGKIIFEGKVKASEVARMSIPAMLGANGEKAVDLYFDANGKIMAGDQEVASYEANTWYTLKILVDSDAQEYEVWIDHIRKLQNVPFSEKADGIKTLSFASEKGTLNVDNLRLYDNTEIYAVADELDDLDNGEISSLDGWTFEGDTSVENVPFESDKSILVSGADSSATRSFDPISGDVTVQVKVKPMTEEWVTMPMVTDANGSVAAKVAFYQNSLYISNGDNWVYVCDQEIPNNYYLTENWFTIKLVMNTYTNRYDFYVDGALRYSDASFAADIDEVSKVVIANEGANMMYIDNILVYDSASLARGLYPQENVFNVRDFGAKGDGVTDDTEAVEKAIAACAGTGGTVLFENGTFYVGQIIPLSDTSIFIDTSATLLFKIDRNEYKHIVASRGYNANHQIGAGLFLTEDGTQNVRIDGGGTIDGDGLYAYNQNDPSNQRPCTMYLTLSHDLYVQNLNVYNAQHWTIVPYESTNLTFRNISICNHIAPNRDGIDPTNCSNMTVENCFIIAGDDAFCPKSGNDVPSWNVDVRNTFLQSYCNGIKFGTDAYDDFKYYNFEDIWMKNVGMSGITLQSVDGSEMRYMTFKRIDMIDVTNSVSLMVGNRERTYSGGGNAAKRLGYIRDLWFEDISFQNAMRGKFCHKDDKASPEMLIYGLSPEKTNIEQLEDHSISNVYFKNVFMETIGGRTSVPGFDDGIGGGYPEYDGLGTSVGYGATVRWANNVQFENFTVVTENEDVREMIAYADYSDLPVIEPGVDVTLPKEYTVFTGATVDSIGLPDSIKVVNADDDQYVDDTAITGWACEGFTGENGTYEFTGKLADSDVTITAVVNVITNPYGDVNEDESVSVADMLKLKDLILADAWTDVQLENGDLNDNGVLDVVDIMMLKKLILLNQE